MRAFNAEQISIAELFRASFPKDAAKPLLIYGIGRNTDAILELCPEIKVTGLMDAKTTETKVFGLPIISTAQAEKMQADIAIVARDSVIPVVYARIKQLDDCGCRIYSVCGARLREQTFKYDGGGLAYWDIGAKDLIAEIDKYEYISFDIFDTLLARRCLYPWSFYALVKRDGFSEVRYNTEKQLGVLAGLDEIYCTLQTKLSLSVSETLSLRRGEFAAELSVVFARQDMKNILAYCLEHKKSVCLLSDTFYSSAEINALLTHCGYPANLPMLLSCEAKASKEDGSLFEKYLSELRATPDKCLHIGDNRFTDVENANKFGLATFHLMSGYSMLEQSALRGLLAKITDEDAIVLGGFVANRLSSPFALKGSRGLFRVDSFDMGYSYIGPLVLAFLQWLCAVIRSEGVTKMLFSARDGYVFSRCYEILRERDASLPDAAYIKISRRCVTVASITEPCDIWKIAARPFAGSVTSFFRQRFGIEVVESGDWSSDESDEILSKYADAILANAAEERREYLYYLSEFHLSGETLGFFDFVSQGTIQHYFERLTEQKCVGIVFASNNLPNELYAADEFHAAFGNMMPYSQGENVFAKHYMKLESIFTDGYTSLVKYRDGEPVYEPGVNEKYLAMSDVHRGIIEYVRKNAQAPHSLSATLHICAALFDGGTVLSEQLKSAFTNDDCYDGIEEYATFT